MQDINTDKVHDHPLASIFLILFGWIVNSLTSITAEEIWIWTFRVISLLSVLLAIAISWRKAMAEIKEIFKKKNKK